MELKIEVPDHLCTKMMEVWVRDIRYVNTRPNLPAEEMLPEYSSIQDPQFKKDAEEWIIDIIKDIFE